MKKFIILASAAICSVNLYANEQSTTVDFYASKEEALEAANLEKFNTKENIELVSKISTNLEKIKANPELGYAGTWIRYDSENRAKHVIAISGNTDESKLTELVPALEIVNVKYSYKDLEGKRSEILNIFKPYSSENNPLILSIAINDEENRLIVRTMKENFSIVNEILSKYEFSSDLFDLEEQSAPARFMWDLYGGTKIGSTTAGTSAMYLCSAGFNVLIDGIYQGNVTAAHCYEQNRAWKDVHFNMGGSPTGSRKGGYIGEYLASGMPFAMDAVLFGNVNHAHNLPPVMMYQNNTARWVNDVASPVMGQTVCRFGGTTGWRCGVQKSTNTSVAIKGRLYNLAEATFCGGGGDSGGPVVNSNFNALGVYTGILGASNNTCGAVVGGGTTISIYQPLIPYFAHFSNVKIKLN
ncbi:S1 family peptidase [Comamonas koreensis]|uniref:S1 family peptidase n=1 Tax=Comamonas koreensis TaxID=160825 RepID=A0AAW4XY43_9BURK|nr:S1 family peptidase [Comamonas koreensis]MCD2166051.1 S1 family peptidase [Comamonas koreensis]